MMFVAQIDLAEVAERAGRSALPAAGALAFFIAHDGACAVVPVTSGSVLASEPPADAPVVLDDTGQIFPERADAPGARVFPCWPVDITPLPTEATEEEQVATIDRLFARRQYFFSADEAYKLAGETARRHWWHGAQYYARCLRKVLRQAPHVFNAQRPYLEKARKEVARLRGESLLSRLFVPAERRAKLDQAVAALAKQEERYESRMRLIPLLERFAAEIEDWAQRQPAWRLMPPADVQRLSEAIARGRSEFKDFCSYPTPSRLSDVETVSLLALATADDRTHAEMPEAVQRVINERYLLPTNTWHQMFGRGVDIQDVAYEQEGNLMLLQLVYDDMIGWQFGDMGAYKFWIPPAALERRDWGAVRLTFECH